MVSTNTLAGFLLSFQRLGGGCTPHTLPVLVVSVSVVVLLSHHCVSLLCDLFFLPADLVTGYDLFQ
jgi:hypothetical protein